MAHLCPGNILNLKLKAVGFAEDIADCRSLAIVGLEKNTGKTECLNYILSRIGGWSDRFALTSIGVDGESLDQVCRTPKPEIEIPSGMLFVTSEKHFREKRLVAEILEMGEERTALGRLVTARAKSTGKVLLSGPADTAGLKRLIGRLKDLGVGTTIVDGAVSRLSLASPAVTEAMILATGASVSVHIPELVRKTKYVFELIGLEEAGSELQERLDGITQGVWAVTADGEIIDLHLPSVFMLGKEEVDLLRFSRCLYVAGAVSDKLFNFLKAQKQAVELIVRDFTRIFAAPETYYAFLRKGGMVKVLHRSRLLAVTVNPVSPSGFVLEAGKVQEALEEALQIPVWNVRKM